MQVDLDRSLIVRAVLQNQISTSHLTDADLLDLELQTMEMLVDEKLTQGLIVFSEHNVLQ